MRYCLQMRRLTPRYKHWLLLRARDAARRRGEQLKWRKAFIATRTGTRLANVRAGNRLPPVLCLDKAYGKPSGSSTTFAYGRPRYLLLRFGCRMAKHGGRIGWVRNYQDFKSLTEISPGAALLMAAEYDRVRTLGGFPVATVDLEGWKSCSLCHIEHARIF